MAIDLDSQGSLTASLGFTHPDKLDISIANMMTGIINEATKILPVYHCDQLLFITHGIATGHKPLKHEILFGKK